MSIKKNRRRSGSSVPCAGIEVTLRLRQGRMRIQASRVVRIDVEAPRLVKLEGFEKLRAGKENSF